MAPVPPEVAMREFRAKLDELRMNQTELFDLSQLSNESFRYDPNEKIPMIGEDGDKFDAERLQQHIVSRFRRQNIAMSTKAWKEMMDLFESFDATRQYEDRIGEIGQIAVEIVSIFSELDAVELFVSTRMGRAYTEDDKLHRDKLMEEEILLLLVRLSDQDLKFSMEDERRDYIRNFLMGDAVAFVISSTFNGCFKRKGSDTMDVKFVKDQANNVKMYFSGSLSKGVLGVTLRDGFVLFCHEFIQSPKETQLAQMMAVAMHVFGHYCARKKYGSYTIPSPNSFLRPPDVPSDSSSQRDPQLDLYNQEFGRAIELMFFAGISPRWGWVEKNTAVSFLEKARQGDKHPWFQSKQQCEEEGFEDDDHLPLSFGAKKIPRAPVMY